MKLRSSGAEARGFLPAWPAPTTRPEAEGEAGNSPGASGEGKLGGVPRERVARKWRPGQLPNQLARAPLLFETLPQKQEWKPPTFRVIVPNIVAFCLVNPHLRVFSHGAFKEGVGKREKGREKHPTGGLPGGP